MLLNVRLLLLSAVFLSVIQCKNENGNYRKGRHFLTLLGYLHGYKIAQDIALQLPPYFVSPVIIVPSVNQQQSVNIQEGSTDENYQENGATVQIIKPEKLVLNVSDSISEDLEIRQSLKRDTTKKYQYVKDNEKNQSKLQNTETERISTEAALPPMKVDQQTKTKTALDSPQLSVKNESLRDSTGAKIPDQILSLPPISDHRWQNFTLKANLSSLMSDENNNVTMTNSLENNTMSPPTTTEIVTEDSTQTVTYGNGPYPTALYNNAMINQLSITTDSFTNEGPPSQYYDRWGSFSEVNKISSQGSSGFKPLAGLYYDGYLHRPLKKFGFLPDNYV